MAFAKVVPVLNRSSRCCFGYAAYHRHAVKFPNKQVKQTVELLNKHRNVLQKYGVQVVPIPVTGARILLYPSNHSEISSIEAVQEIVQTFRPHLICPELCPEREATLRGIRQRLLHKDSFLLKDVADMLRRQRDALTGGDMAVAVLEADRHKIPIRLVDRSVHVTEARLRASVPDETVLALWSPTWLSKLALASALRGKARTKGQTLYLPVEVVKRMFLRHLQLPWRFRFDIIDQAIRIDGELMVSAEHVKNAIICYNKMRATQNELSIQELKQQAQDLCQDVMPVYYAVQLGPETLPDICARVISAERDVVIAHKIREAVIPSPDVRGPLAFAPIGAAHLRGVSEHLTMDSIKLSALAQPLFHAPDVPWWKRVSLPMNRMLRFLQCVLMMPEVIPGPRRGSHHLALA